MTQVQIDQLERAITRATEEGITVKAQGTIKSNGTRFFLTNSASRHGGYHVVTWQGMRLLCDCEGSQHGYICKHAGAVRMHLEHLASREQAKAERFEAAMQVQASVALAAKPQVRGVNDTRTVSIFK